MRIKKIFFVSCLIWAIGVFCVFNHFAYPIDSFNAALRNYIKTGALNVREFNNEGLPLSSSPRIGNFISPFYVVHYGVLYSNGLREGGAHWRIDPSLGYWNVQPPEITYERRVKYFKSSADWVFAHSKMLNGHIHLLYNFDWPYSNYPNDGLTAPWWSGLSDSYAMMLLLRAYDYFGEDKYLELANKFYLSAVNLASNGGAVVRFNGCPWIEEYIDPRAAQQDMSFVFNGMVYATRAIESYEKYTKVNMPIYPQLYDCIAQNINGYDLDGWSYYDGIGNASNIKYHHISYSLLNDMIIQGKIPSHEGVEDVLQSWRRGFYNPGFYYVLRGVRSVSYIHFIAFFWLCICVPPGLILWRLRSARLL